MNTEGTHDVNEDSIPIEVKNDENEDGNEQRQETNNLLVNESIPVEEKNLLVDDNEPKKAADVNEDLILEEVENEKRQTTNMLNDGQTHVEEIDICKPMDSQSHGVVESVPTVVEVESADSSQNGRRMRNKKRSLILQSPFTNPEKRRKLGNVKAFDPFRELDSAKADDLENWLVNVPDRWLTNMTRYIYGLSPEKSKRWDSCTSLYIPCNVEMKHWITLKVDLAERTIYVYDSMKSCTRFGKLEKVMRPLVKVIPRMMKESSLFGENYPRKQFVWRRHAEVPQQNNA
ncbi:sentrin-specific protease 1-like [Olea europaea subsp. europaea]|uniref:Sentrin-specific protease 1-like n=1 Tax=Olea europaea subsp. europaea TaxID=158383 RepID=A0A8S0TA15_OLEEU|nr:sentrin-specific protease 1-like [Olea europaea subsp. europaea]